MSIVQLLSERSTAFVVAGNGIAYRLTHPNSGALANIAIAMVAARTSLLEEEAKKRGWDPDALKVADREALEETIGANPERLGRLMDAQRSHVVECVDGVAHSGDLEEGLHVGASDLPWERVVLVLENPDPDAEPPRIHLDALPVPHVAAIGSAVDKWLSPKEHLQPVRRESSSAADARCDSASLREIAV